MRFCAYRERCVQEVSQKLYELGCPEELREEVIVELLDQDFLNEERYARSYVGGKFRMKDWGRIKIRQGLRAKQIDEKLIEFALQEELEEEDYQKTLRELAKKKGALLGLSDPHETREKVRNYLISKGFEYDETDRVLGEIRF
ncbi:MAG: RecX family transcriptional regulator [Bacteroidia bacterium]|nr:RecX family transcriptional regulator [Bacteroidia bacterium]